MTGNDGGGYGGQADAGGDAGERRIVGVRHEGPVNGIAGPRFGIADEGEQIEDITW